MENHHNHQISGSMSTIPIVDFGPVRLHPDDPSAWTATVQQLDDALSSIGFVYLTNHGVPAASIESAFSVARSFFTLSPDVKALYTKRFSAVGKSEGDVSPADYNGYVPAGDELLDKSSVHEIRESFDVMGAREGRVFPSTAHVPNFQAVVESLHGQFVQLALKFGRALGVALLGLEHVDFFGERLRSLQDASVPGLNQVRLLYYPEIARSVGVGRTPEEGAGITRCFQHSDYGMFTFLVQDGVGGLEVKGVKGGWVPAPPVEGALLVNTGDLLQFWSGGHYPATVHRVRIQTEPLNDHVHAPTRQSIAFFVNPDDHVNVSPLKTKFSTSTSDGEAEAEAPAEVNALEYVMRLIKNAYRIPEPGN